MLMCMIHSKVNVTLVHGINYPALSVHDNQLAPLLFRHYDYAGSMTTLSGYTVAMHT